MQLSLFNQEPPQAFEQQTWFQELLESLGIQRKSGWPDDFGSAIRGWIMPQSRPRARTLSLFSGGGGLDIAFRDAGFEIVEMVEIDPRYSKTLQRNFANHSKVTCQDIHDYLPDPVMAIDFIIGGPPCQSFSAAGRRAAGVSGTNDPRGTLFQEYVRILHVLQPKGFLFENVYGITGAQQGEAWREIQTAFKEAGYTLFFKLLDAADYGVPQHRERLFIIGLKEGQFLFPCPTHGPDSPGKETYYSAGEAVYTADTTDKSGDIGGRYGGLFNTIPPGLNYSFYTKEMGHPSPVFSWRSKFSDFLYKADPERPVRTIKAQGGQYTGPFSWDNRVFTVPELKRLQTFPDDYVIVGGRQVSIEQIGNSVPPQIGRILALSILDQVIGVNLPFTMHYLPKEKMLGFRQRKRALTEHYAQKARVAIAELQSSHRFGVITDNTTLSRVTFTRFLGEDFSWSQEKHYNSTKIDLDFQADQQAWNITAHHVEQKNGASPSFFIQVTPVMEANWPLKTTAVQLCGTQLDTVLFTGLWKAFEEKIVEISGIADLVQLCGYYQYHAKIKAQLQFENYHQNHSIWRIIQLITQGVGVGQQIESQKLAFLWECDYSSLMDYLVELKNIGFEVRSHKTNPQISLGDYLIPYIFPTFTPKSVQRRKSLREHHAK